MRRSRLPNLSAVTALVLLLPAALLVACSASKPPLRTTPPSDAPLSMAESRFVETGGLAAAAARPLPPVATDASLSPLGRDWVFTMLDGYDGPLPGPPPQPGFTLVSEDRRMAGSTGCNRMMAAYDIGLDSGTLEFRNLSNTRKMCPRVAADTEQAVISALVATDGWRLVGNDLELLSGGKVVARLSAP